MTTSTIHPIIWEKLQRFSRQRRRLIIWRGVCSALAMWFATMMAVALIDRFVLMPDGLRLGLSVTGYVATAVMFWLECGRQLAHMPDVRELARLVELAAPQLREELLSAVELAESGQQPHWDSDEFRAALQQATARDVGAVRIEGLLTRKLIAGWLYSVATAFAVLLVLLIMPGLRFRQSFARAVAPGANLARYSSIQITVTAPTPPDQIEPEGDSVPVTVEVTGANVQAVVLEIFPQHGPRERIPMLLSAVNQFTAAIQLNQELVQFRVRAEDALTRKYTLTPRARPHVVKFQKTYHYPAYSQLPAKTVKEENGDLDALEGTEVELRLDVDQPIKEAALQLDNKKLPFAQTGGQLVARVPLTTSGIYQVHLVAAQTGFENKYSPQYEIRIRPDLLPFAKIDKPEKDELVLPPDSIVNLTGSAKDDFGIARVEQMIQVNRGAWQTFPLAQTNSLETKVARTWDLFDLGVHPGDRVITKLAATDLKGQRGESVPLRIRIATAGFDPDRLNALKERQALNSSIHDFRETAEQLDTKTREARVIVNNPAADPLQKKQALLAASAVADVADRKAEEVLRQIKVALPQTKSDRESADLALVGTAISRAQHDGVESVKAALELATANTNVTKAALEKVLEPLATGTALTRAADDTHRQLLAAAEANAATRDLQQLADEQRTMTNDVSQIDRTAHRQAVAAAETKSIEEQLKTIAEHAGPGVAANTARNLERNLTLSRENVEKVLTNQPSAESLKVPAGQLQRSVENASEAMRNAGRELDQRADAARKALQDQTGTAADAVAKIAAKPENLQSTTEQLKDRAALEERRPHADAPFVAAIGKTADALDALQDVTRTNAVAAAKAIESALRKLEVGHALDEQVAGLHQLAAQERWEKPVATSDWQTQQQQMQSLPQQLARAQLPVDAKRAVENAVKSPTVQQINNDIAQRQTDPLSLNKVAEPLAKLAGEMAQAKQQLQPAMEQARAEIEKYTPALSDRLAGLARVAEKLENETIAQTRQPDANQIQNLADAQQRLDNRVEDVKDALRRDASAQSLGTDEGRARARDADDAAAMLRQPTPNANDLLQHAAKAAQPEPDLKAAAAQQGKLADDLKLLAEHYKNTEAGQPDATRAALRDAEKELGLKPTLDAEYAKAQALEHLAGLTPQEQLAELESALPNSKPMRRELSDIAKDTLQSAAADLQKSADKERQIAQQPVIEQVKRIAEEAQKIARQDLPTVAKQAGEIAKPELNNAGQKLASVAQNLPQDALKPPEQLAQAIQNQVAPLLQAATDLNKAATKLEQDAQQKTNNVSAAAAKQAQQASDKAQQLAQKAGQLATGLNPATPQEQAKHIAEETKKLAEQALPAVAAKAGETAKPELTAAGEKLASVAQDLAKPTEQLAKALQSQVAPLQQAAADLNKALDKLAQKAAAAMQEALANKGNPELAKQAQAAAQQAQGAQLEAKEAGLLASLLAQMANQLADALDEAKIAKAVTPSPTAEQAKQLAAAAQKLARQDLPALTQQAGPTAKPELTAAGQKLDAVAQNVPQDFSKPPEQLVQQMQNQVAPLQQAASDLNNAAGKLGQVAQAAQQKADAAAQSAQQAKANNAGEAAVKQAEAAQQQSQAAAQQAQAAQQKAQQASQQAGQLAQQAGQLAAALNQAKPQMQAIAQQPAIAENVRDAGTDVARAGRHEGRLGQEETSKELQQLGQQIEQQTGAQVAEAADAMAQANSPAQVQAAAKNAHDAIESPLNDLNSALQQSPPPPGNATPSQETSSQLAAAPEEAAKWMARALDSLDAALSPSAPAPEGQSTQAAQNAAAQAAKSAAQAQAGTMMAARSQGMSPGEQSLPQGTSAGGGLAGKASGTETTPLPELNPTGGNWGKLPPKLARDLMDSQREGVSGQYREMVEMYFRALADKAREKQP